MTFLFLIGYEKNGLWLLVLKYRYIPTIKVNFSRTLIGREDITSTWTGYYQTFLYILKRSLSKNRRYLPLTYFLLDIRWPHIVRPVIQEPRSKFKIVEWQSRAPQPRFCRGVLRHVPTQNQFKSLSFYNS